MTETDPRFPGTGSYLDWLMALDPLDLSAQNIDSIIAYYRNGRAQHDSGTRPKRRQSSDPIDLAAIGLASAPAPIKRRKL